MSLLPMLLRIEPAPEGGYDWFLRIPHPQGVFAAQSWHQSRRVAFETAVEVARLRMALAELPQPAPTPKEMESEPLICTGRDI